MSDALTTLAQFVSDRIGVTIDTRRRTSIESRLAPLMEHRGFATIQDLVVRLLQDRDPDLLSSVIDALVTCETLFFRDRAPFEALRALILPKLREARRETRSIRIWSAACATGQEPYSIAMLLDESAREFAGWRIDLFASDISKAALATAAAGRYTQFEVQRGLPTPLLLRHFTKDEDGWRIAEHLRATIDFRRINLLSDFARHGKFDVVLCRNVLMYMNVERRRDVLARIARQLAPDGYLMMGATETIVGLSDEFVATPGHAGLFTRTTVEAPRLRLVANS